MARFIISAAYLTPMLLIISACLGYNQGYKDGIKEGEANVLMQNAGKCFKHIERHE
jgi:hypothetical protein